jgi:pimeloyl-ACP methyl ester carboxylesterase
MDIKLFFTEEGEGFPLVLLHGNSESSVYFKNQIGFFAKFFRVIAVDTRGHGRSPRGSAPFTLSRFADDLKDSSMSSVLQRLISWVFPTAAISRSFRAAAPGQGRKTRYKRRRPEPPRREAGHTDPIELGYRAASLLSLLDRRAVPKKEMLGLMVGQPDITPDELAKLQMPVLVIAGTRDLIKDAHTRMIAASIPARSFTSSRATFHCPKKPRRV